MPYSLEGVLTMTGLKIMTGITAKQGRVKLSWTNDTIKTVYTVSAGKAEVYRGLSYTEATKFYNRLTSKQTI